MIWNCFDWIRSIKWLHDIRIFFPLGRKLHQASKYLRSWLVGKNFWNSEENWKENCVINWWKNFIKSMKRTRRKSIICCFLWKCFVGGNNLRNCTRKTEEKLDADLRVRMSIGSMAWVWNLYHGPQKTQ